MKQAILVSAVLITFASQSLGQQNLLPPRPACAQQCANLLQAQTACTPPPNPPPGGTYGIQCLCGFAPLLSLKEAAPVNLCAGCSTEDNALIQEWFQTRCAEGGTSDSGNSNPAANGQTTSSSVQGQGQTSTASAASPRNTNQGVTVDGHAATATNKEEGSWYDIP